MEALPGLGALLTPSTAAPRHRGGSLTTNQQTSWLSQETFAEQSGNSICGAMQTFSTRPQLSPAEFVLDGLRQNAESSPGGSPNTPAPEVTTSVALHVEHLRWPSGGSRGFRWPRCRRDLQDSPARRRPCRPAHLHVHPCHEPTSYERLGLCKAPAVGSPGGQASQAPAGEPLQRATLRHQSCLRSSLLQLIASNWASSTFAGQRLVMRQHTARQKKWTGDRH